METENEKKKKELEKLLALCSVSTKVLAKTFFPERFVAEFSPLHEIILQKIDSPSRHTGVAAPRGIGKTSLVGLAKTTQAILFGKYKFIVYVSNSFDNAAMQTENLKRELTTNRLIRQLFGPIKARKIQDEDGFSDMDESFSKKMWITSTGVCVLPRGSGQQVRGLLFGNRRPDLIIVDDLEDTETIASDDVRKKRANWFDADLLNCVSQTDLNYKFIYIDTLKHHDALLEHILSDKSGMWDSVRLELCDDNLKSNAPTFVSDEEILKKYNYYKAKGQLDVFYQELRNKAISTEDSSFKPEYFKNYEERDLANKRIENILILDPAKTVKTQSDWSALVVVGLDMESGAIYVRDIIAGMFYPDEIYTHLFELAYKWRCRTVGVEVTSLHEFITQPIRNEMSKRGSFFDLVELNATGKKEQRISALVPYYRQGYIYHNASSCFVLETQLLEFPRPKRWDVMDALAYIVKMMEMGLRYFDPPEEMVDDMFEHDLEELAKLDKELDEDWRLI